jgi:hypothetical protein
MAVHAILTHVPAGHQIAAAGVSKPVLYRYTDKAQLWVASASGWPRQSATRWRR